MKLAIVALAAAAYAFAADPTGKWKATVATNNGEMEIVYDLKLEAGKLSGTVSSQMGDVKVSSGKVEGDDIEFTLIVELNGQERRFVHKGKVNGSEMKLSVDSGNRVVEISAKKQ